MTRGRALLIIALLQIILLAGMIGSKYYTLQFGAQVLLKTSPVDPWDMFRGEYVRLGYDISRISGNLAGDLDHAAANNKISAAYVVLEPDGRYWKAVAIYKNHPGAREGRVVIKGNQVLYDSHSNEYRLTYGIESYYVEEGQGLKMEQSGNLDVLVRVDRFGRAAIEKVVSAKEK